MVARYFPDDDHGAVMVKKVGKGWGEYYLKEVEYKESPSSRIPKLKFIFETKPRKVWNYKIYDEGDGYSTPDPLFDHIRRMNLHMISRV